MKKHLLFFFLYASFTLFSQKSIQLEEIWNGSFRPKYLNEIHHLNNSEEYTYLDYNRSTKVTSIIAKAYDSMDERTIISNKDVKLNYFSTYTFSNNEQKLLLGTNIKSRYRYSSTGIYYAYDIHSKSLTQLFEKAICNPSFSPDGSKVTFVYENNIYIKDLISQKITQVTRDGKENSIINGLSDWVYEEEFELINTIKWSPDGKQIAFLKFDETKVREYSMPIYGQENYPSLHIFKYPKAGENNSIVTAHIFNIKKQITTSVDFKNTPYYIPRLLWRNEKEIAFQTLNRHQNKLNIYSFNTRNQKIETIYSEENDTYVEIDNHFQFSKNGDYYLTSEKDGFNHIYYYDDLGAETQITAGNWEVTELYDFNEQKKEFYFQSNKGNEIERQIFSVNFDQQLIPLTTNSGKHEASFNKNQSLFIDTFSSQTVPYKFDVIYINKTKSSRNLLNNDKLLANLKSYQLPKKEFKKIYLNGFELNSYIIKPSNFDGTKKYPILLYQYSGPGSQMVKNTWQSYNDYWHYLLAEKGYIVACIDGRGTGAKGASFKKLTQLQLGKLEAEDQIAFAKHLGKEKFIDKTRIGIWGWSFGGFTALNSILKSNTTFKTAISVAPVTHWGYYDTIYTERFLKTPQENKSGYNDNSPITYAKNLNCPLLLVHGGADDNVHLQNTLQLSTALVKHNKAFDQEIYTNKNHGIYGGYTRLHLYKKMTNFILENL